METARQCHILIPNTTAPDTGRADPRQSIAHLEAGQCVFIQKPAQRARSSFALGEVSAEKSPFNKAEIRYCGDYWSIRSASSGGHHLQPNDGPGFIVLPSEATVTDTCQRPVKSIKPTW